MKQACFLLLSLASQAILAAAEPTPPVSAPPSISFGSGSKGNVFLAETGEMRLAIKKGESVTGGTVSVKDEHGKVVAETPVLAGATDVQVPLPHRGYYALEGTVNYQGGEVSTARATAAVIGPALDEALRMKSRFGLWTVNGDPTMVAAAGARWNRQMGSLRDMTRDYPAGLEPVKPEPETAKFSNVGVFAFGLPLWMMDVPKDYVQKGFGNPFFPPKDWEEFRDMVKAYVAQPPKWEKFPPYFELFNEPEWHWEGTEEDLFKLMKIAADAIHEVRPDVKVLGPGFSSIRIKDPARLDLETVAKHGLLEHLDGIVVHAYVDGEAPEGLFMDRVFELKEFLASIGKPEFPIHLTEFGWCTVPGTWQRPVDELTQARYLVRSLSLLAAAGVENSTYFSYLYNNIKNAGETSFSIAWPDATPKPAYAAFANLTRWLSGIEGDGHWLRLTPTTHLVVFRTDQKAVGVLWDVSEDKTINLPGSITRAADMTGRPLAAADATELMVSPSPLFLEFEDVSLYEAKSESPLRVMRGNESALPQADGLSWIAPAPLEVKAGQLVVPQTVREGAYLLLAQADQGWRTLPVEVVTPMVVDPVRVLWPLTDDAPTLSVSLQSHTPDSLSTTLSAKIANARTVFGEPTIIEPNSSSTLGLQLESFELGRRYRGTLAVESREGERRDRMEQPLDFTVVGAFPVKQGSAPDWDSIEPVDFSDWDPFGEKSEEADCSATLQAAYDARALRLLVRVRDDDHVQASTPEKLWSEDSIQLGFDVDAEKTWEANDLFGLRGHRVFEYGVAWTGKESMNWRWISYTKELPAGMSDPRVSVKVRREGDVTVYDLTFPWEVLGLKKSPDAGSAIGIALAVTDIDSNKPKSSRGLRLFGGIKDAKDPEKYGKLWLR